MRRPPKVPWSVRRLFRLPASPERLGAELDEEARIHIAMRVDELRARGWSEGDARAEAIRQFGDFDDFQAYARRRSEVKGRRIGAAEFIDGLRQDLRFAWRQLLRAPVISALAVLTLALGIGANTAIFTVVYRLMLAPLPYPNASRLVMPMQNDGRGGIASARLELVVAWQERSTLVEEVAAASAGTFTVEPDGAVNMIAHAVASPSYFRVLGVRPSLGRFFDSTDTRPDAPAVAILSTAAWQRDYGGRGDALGKTIRLDGKTYTIVGVTPPGTSIPLATTPEPEIWFPATLTWIINGRSPTPVTFALMRAGVTAAQVTRELETIAPSITGLRQPITGARGMRAQDFIGQREQLSIRVLFAAVGVLLLIACANVASLMLGRAWTRRQEFAVRASLGAERHRIVRQVIIESLVLAALSGVAGFLVAIATQRSIALLRPPGLEHVLLPESVNGVMLLWTSGISVLAGLLLGAAPALSAAGLSPSDLLRSASTRATESRSGRAARRGLVIGEIALSVVLLIGSGLLVRSFVALQRIPAGFEPEGLVYAEIIANPRDRNRLQALTAEVMDRIRAVPGVREVSIGTMPGRAMVGAGVALHATLGDRRAEVLNFGTNFISSNYFRVAGMRFIEGVAPDPVTSPRDTSRGLMSGRSLDVVVSRGLARKIAGDGSVIGARIQTPMGPIRGPAGPEMRVVGVVDDIRLPDGNADARSVQLYALIPPQLGNINFLIRTSGAPGIAREIWEAIRKDRTLVIRPTYTATEYVREASAPSRFAMALLTAFAVVALVLSATGLYGVVAYGVAQRSREIAIRVALGAEPVSVAGMIVWTEARVGALGLTIGLVGAALVTRLLARMLYGVQPLDPLTFGSIAVLVAGIALVASSFPARRAIRIDPVATLRME